MFETAQGVIKPIVYVGVIHDQKLLLVDYKVVPNPHKTGWWIPAPGLEYGEDPREKAQDTLKELGIPASEVKLHNVESFVTPGGWHLIYHFRAYVNSDKIDSGSIKDYKWVSASELTQIKNMAHGQWEIQVGLGYLG